jgi:hypothetical protein
MSCGVFEIVSVVVDKITEEKRREEAELGSLRYRFIGNKLICVNRADIHSEYIGNADVICSRKEDNGKQFEIIDVVSMEQKINGYKYRLVLNDNINEIFYILINDRGKYYDSAVDILYSRDNAREKRKSINDIFWLEEINVHIELNAAEEEEQERLAEEEATRIAEAKEAAFEKCIEDNKRKINYGGSLLKHALIDDTIIGALFGLGLENNIELKKGAIYAISGSVADITKGGVIIDGLKRIFVYTSDDYYDGQLLKTDGFLYEYVGNYKSNTIMGITSIPAFKRSKYRVSAFEAGCSKIASN